jgi:hypothetical protein
MSDIPAWPSSSGWSAGQDDRPAPILLAFGGPFPQRRLTVLFRFILFIPHYFVLYVLSIAAEVIAVIGWFAALFLGRLPEFAAEFLTGYLRWQTRVMAYMLLLTDQYPPFALDDAAYPVRIALRPGRLNRLAVFFRVILAIPVVVVAMLLLWGACTIALFVTWLIVLIAGRMPETLYAALAAVLRYQARISGYMLLLTSAYPSGLFGDRPDPGEPWATADPGGFTAGPGGFAGPVSGFATDPSGFPAPGGAFATDPRGFRAPGGAFAAEPGGFAPGGGFASGAGGPGPEAGGFAAPGGFAPGPGFAAAPGEFGGPGAGYGYTGPAGAGPAGARLLVGASPQSWRLVLSGQAKRLVAVFLALGVVIAAACIAGGAVFGAQATNSANTRVTADNAAAQLQADIGPLNQAVTTFGTTTSKCRTSATRFACVTAADGSLGDSFDVFAAQIRQVSMPPGAAMTAARQLENSAARAGLIFRRLAAAKSAARYQAVLTTVNVDQAMNRFAQDYQGLANALNHA